MALPEYPRPAQFRGDLSAWITGISAIISAMLKGRQNIVGEVTLTADDESTITVVTDDRCHKYSSITFDPISQRSAALFSTGEIYVSADDRTEGMFTINHPVFEAGGQEASFYYTIQG